MTINLSNKIGICISHWPLEPIDWWLKAGCRHFRIGIEWDVFNEKEGEFKFDVANDAFQMIQDAGGKILVHLFGVPARLAPQYPRIRNSNAIPIMRDEWVVEWVDYVGRFLEWVDQFEDTVEVCGPIVETNLPGWWEDEQTKRERSAEDFLRLVVRPVTPLIRMSGRKVISGTVTIQGERGWTFNRAMRQFEAYKLKSFGAMDHLDFHVYREVGDQTVNDIKRVFRHFESMGKPIAYPVWISELGFNERGGFTWWEEFLNDLRGKDIPGEQRQELKYKQLFRFLESTKPEDRAITDKIKRIYLYRGHAGKEGRFADELLKPPIVEGQPWQPKKAALLIREYLQAA